MKEIEEVVLKCYKKVLEDNGFNIEIDLDNKISEKYGLDSLNFVELVLSIEEELGIVMDSILAKIRKCKNIREMIETIADYKNNQNA